MTSNCVYISAKTRLLNKNLILRQARAQNSILCDSFTGISNTRYRRMVKSDFQLDDFLFDAAFIFYRIKCSLCSVDMPCWVCVKLTQDARRTQANFSGGYDSPSPRHFGWCCALLYLLFLKFDLSLALIG